MQKLLICVIACLLAACSGAGQGDAVPLATVTSTGPPVEVRFDGETATTAIDLVDDLARGVIRSGDRVWLPTTGDGSQHYIARAIRSGPVPEPVTEEVTDTPGSAIVDAFLTALQNILEEEGGNRTIGWTLAASYDRSQPITRPRDGETLWAGDASGTSTFLLRSGIVGKTESNLTDSRAALLVSDGMELPSATDQRSTMVALNGSGADDFSLIPANRPAIVPYQPAPAASWMAPGRGWVGGSLRISDPVFGFAFANEDGLTRDMLIGGVDPATYYAPFADIPSDFNARFLDEMINPTNDAFDVSTILLGVTLTHEQDVDRIRALLR